MDERKKRAKLQKSMGPGSIWAVAVGSIIGWGCFLQGGIWTERAGGPLPLFLGFLIGGLLMIVVGYSYSYMIAKFPVAGGEFAYATRLRPHGFVCVRLDAVAGLSGYRGTERDSTACAGIVYLPGRVHARIPVHDSGYDVYLGEVALSLFFIILFGIMNYRGAKSVGNLQLAMVLIMCAAVVVSVVGVVVTGHFDTANLQRPTARAASRSAADWLDSGSCAVPVCRL